jgi:cytoskeletal protein CcmA (bactofilin family)
MTKTIGAGAVITLMFAVPLTLFAAEMRVGEQPSLASNERISDDFYIAGGNVSSGGPVAGDLVAAGGNVLINSAVTGDLLAGGGTVSILGTVSDDVRVGGGNITIGGQVRGDVVAGGGQTQISGAGVGGDVLWGGGTLRIEAPVAGDLKLAGGDVYLNSTVVGNVEFMGEKLTLGRGAIIEGNLTYKSPNEAVMEEGAAVRGTTDFQKQESKGASKAGFAAFASLAVLMGFLMRFACALALALIFHRYARTLVESVTRKPLLELGRGFAAFAVVPVASVVLMITVLGLPLGFLGMLAFVALLIFASLLAPVVLGSVVHKLALKPANYEVTWLTILIGVVLYTILGWIPFVGWIAKFALVLMTIGAIAKVKWDAGKEWR